MKFTIEIKDGKVVSQGIGDYLRSRPDGVYQISIGKNIRTLDQNRYYRLILHIIGDELGYYPQEIHDIMKYRFELDTTTDLSRASFSEYIEKIRQYFLIEFGIDTPDADPTRK